MNLESRVASYGNIALLKQFSQWSTSSVEMANSFCCCQEQFMSATKLFFGTSAPLMDSFWFWVSPIKHLPSSSSLVRRLKIGFKSLKRAAGSLFLSSYSFSLLQNLHQLLSPLEEMVCWDIGNAAFVFTRVDLLTPPKSTLQVLLFLAFLRAAIRVFIIKFTNFFRAVSLKKFGFHYYKILRLNFR